MSDQMMEVEIGDEVGKGKYWSAMRVLYSYGATGAVMVVLVLAETAVSRYRTIVNGDGVRAAAFSDFSDITPPVFPSLPFPSLPLPVQYSFSFFHP